MHALRLITPRQDWGLLHTLAQEELSRDARRKQHALDDRSGVLVEFWLPTLGAWGPQPASLHLPAHVRPGALIDDLRDLSAFFRLVRREPVRRTGILVCSALVVACRAHPDHAPVNLLGDLRYLVVSSRQEHSPRVLGHIAAVVRGDGEVSVP